MDDFSLRDKALFILLIPVALVDWLVERVVGRDLDPEQIDSIERGYKGGR